jgi:hypothetical protein
MLKSQPLRSKVNSDTNKFLILACFWEELTKGKVLSKTLQETKEQLLHLKNKFWRSVKHKTSFESEIRFLRIQAFTKIVKWQCQVLYFFEVSAYRTDIFVLLFKNANIILTWSKHFVCVALNAHNKHVHSQRYAHRVNFQKNYNISFVVPQRICLSSKWFDQKEKKFQRSN